MSGARKTPTSAKASPAKALARTPQSNFVAPRKRPWLLALAVTLVIGWLAFLAVMAFGG